MTSRTFLWELASWCESSCLSLHSSQNQAERGHKVRLAVGSGLRPDTWERFVRRFGPLQVLETYGLTEGNVATFNYTGQRGAVGRASWLYKVRGREEARDPAGQQGVGWEGVHATEMTRCLGLPSPACLPLLFDSL